MAETNSSTENANGSRHPFDVVIAGAGYAGLAMALALKTSLPKMKVAIIDPRDVRAPTEDQRSSAIAASGRNLFQALGVWDDMVSAAEPIREMIVTDSETGDAVRPVFLNFTGDADGAAPFAHMVPNQVMVRTLSAAAENRGLVFLPPGRVTHFSLEGPVQRLTLSTGEIIETRLLIAADGVRSALRQLAGIRTVGWQYGQSAIVCTIAHTEPHHGRAWEHFLPAGPFAILPLPSKGDQHRSSLVWTEADGDAKRLVAGDEFTFRMELERRIGHELGTLSLASPSIRLPVRVLIWVCAMLPPWRKLWSMPPVWGLISAHWTCCKPTSAGAAPTPCRWRPRRISSTACSPTICRQSVWPAHSALDWSTACRG